MDIKHIRMGQIIVGRKKELAQIDQYYNSGKAEFIAVYGRRRVGKTYLFAGISRISLYLI